MSRISKFLENEIDRAGEYLAMAKTILTIPSELCENNCDSISCELDENDKEVIKILNDELPRIEERINDAKEIISKFKNRTFNLIEK